MRSSRRCDVEAFPGINLIPLDQTLAREAAQIAIEHRLSGADATYVAGATVFGAMLDLLGQGDAAALSSGCDDNGPGPMEYRVMAFSSRVRQARTG